MTGPIQSEPHFTDQQADQWTAAMKRYLAELDRVDPEHEDGILGASINQDARAAVDDKVRDAATRLLTIGRAAGYDTSKW